MLACAIVPPVPVPYRESLFARLAARPDLRLQVIYQASSQASWDQADGWFPSEHRYDARHLVARQLARPGRSPISWPRGLEQALRAFDADVVVVSEFGPATLRALAWCRRRRRALVVLSEVTREVELTLPAPQRALHRWLARRADGFVAVGSAARERLLGLGAPPDAVTVSLQPVDEDALLAACRAHEQARAARGEPAVARGRLVDASGTTEEAAGTPVEVLAVARLVPDKQVGTLLQALAQSGLDAREATLSVVGGGPLQGELSQRARELRLAASFEGAVPAEELPARYAAADVFAMPSSFEPFGVALREAVVVGLPVVCSTAVGASADFAREGRNALLVPPGDVGALAVALRRLCRDAVLRRQLAAGSVRLAAQHPLQVDVDAFAAAISRAASAARARR